MSAVAFFEPADALVCPTIPARPAWHAEAACRGVGPDLFFGKRGHADYGQAAELCGRCPVRAECDLEAEQLPYTLRLYGYRAGLTPHDRTRLRRRTGALAAS